MTLAQVAPSCGFVGWGPSLVDAMPSTLFASIDRGRRPVGRAEEREVGGRGTTGRLGCWRRERASAPDVCAREAVLSIGSWGAGGGRGQSITSHPRSSTSYSTRTATKMHG